MVAKHKVITTRASFAMGIQQSTMIMAKLALVVITLCFATLYPSMGKKTYLVETKEKGAKDYHDYNGDYTMDNNKGHDYTKHHLNKDYNTDYAKKQNNDYNREYAKKHGDYFDYYV